MNAHYAETSDIVRIQNLSRRFDHIDALNQVSIQVKKGQVFGIVGENGAGKTTLIKHILGLYQAQHGEVRVFGQNPVKHPGSVLSNIGYLSEEPDMPAWMKVSEIVNYLAAFYPKWDMPYAEKLLGIFGVDHSKKIKSLSKGQKARVGLCLAQAHRPELLLLDEPSSGLDPNVRNDILRAIIRTVADEGRTVIFSSHLLDEVERVCDHLMMLSHGQVLLSEPMEDVLSRHHRLTLKASDHCAHLTSIPGFINSTQSGNEYSLDCFGDLNQIQVQLREMDITMLSHRSLALNEVFITRSKSSLSPKKAVQ